MIVGARRKALRHRLYCYDRQQTRNLCNARKCDRVKGSAERLLREVRDLENQVKARLVPAAAVTPAHQVIWTIIEPKASVAGTRSPWLNLNA